MLNKPSSTFETHYFEKSFLDWPQTCHPSVLAYWTAKITGLLYQAVVDILSSTYTSLGSTLSA